MVPPKPTLSAFTILLCFLLAFISTEAQVDCIPTWHHEIRGTDHTESRDIRYLPDGTSIVAGRAMNSGNYDGLVMRLSATGDVLWSTTTGGAGDDELTGICPLSNGDFLLYGVTTSYGHPAGKVWLVCVSGGGTVLWSRQLGSVMPGADRPKAIQQFTDGDIIGTYTIDDSTATSDPVIFKMGLNGTVRWSKRFDNGSGEGFSSLAFTGNTIYAAGFYTGAMRQGVIVQVNSGDGSLLSSTTVYRFAGTRHEEVNALEIFNNIISYGVWSKVAASDAGASNVALVQTDLQGNVRYTMGLQLLDTRDRIAVRRTADEGFILLFVNNYNYGAPFIRKLNRYGAIDWARLLEQSYLSLESNGFYPTPDNGCVVAGYYKHFYFTSNINRLMVTRVNNRGESGACLPQPGFGGWPPDTAYCRQKAFTWAGITDFTTGLQDVLTQTGQAYTVSENKLCAETFCTDKTPLPPDCNKTYRIEYSTYMATAYLDAVSTTDGGRIAVGTLKDQGIAVKFNAGGDVVWSKSFGEMASGMQLNRIIRTPDGNLLATGQVTKVLDHGVYEYAVLVKLDNNGNILWSRYLNLNTTYDENIADVALAPDGGIVLLVVDGSSYTTRIYVMRLDAAMNVVWKKAIEYSGSSPLYRSITCTPHAVLVAHENYFYASGKLFGVDRLDLATGNKIWSKMLVAGNTTYNQQVNYLCAINDTAWLFSNQSLLNSPFPYTESINIVAIDPAGNLTKTMNFKVDQIQLPYYLSINNKTASPTVAVTADNDFIFTQRVKSGNDTALNITRIKRDGTIPWSQNYPDMKHYMVQNMHAQAKGMMITGATLAPKASHSNFTQGFMLKTDSAGHIVYPNSGACQSVNTTTATISPLTLTEDLNIVSTVVDYPTVSLLPAAVMNLDVPTDATLYCYEPTQCRQVTLGQRGNGCTLTDTLVYFLQDAAACGAVATWQYDTVFFKTTLLSTDTLRLVPKQTGTSTIQAQLEGYCFMDTKSIQASILVSASQVTLGQDTIVCEGGSVRIKAGPGYASYTWNNGATGAELVVDAPGKYYVDVTDNCGGTGSDTIIVSRAGDLFSVITPNPNKCNNDPIWLEAGGGFLNYQWSTQTGAQGQGNRISVNPAVTTKYYIQAEKWPGCQVKDSVLVNVLHSPAITLPADTRICAGDSLLLDAGPLFNSYNWNSGDNTQQIMVRNAGKYRVTATYSNGCQSKDSFELSLNSLPMPVLDKKPVLCTGTTRYLTPGQFADYLWNNGSTGSSLAVSTTGTWWVTVTDQNGCKSTDTAKIMDIVPLPQDFLTAELEICQYGELKIVPLHNYTTYNWSDHSQGAILTINKPGTYWLEATDQNNCKGRDTVNVVQKECLVGLYIPTAFTPNGDNHNDVFTPLLYGNATSIVFVVYNRWGQKVYETHTLRRGWDGKINGVPATPGTYVWQCRYKLDGQPEKLEKGIVQLIR